ncbi:PepSY domain-containing protein [Yersinia ruckeri]|nr:PepSY-associated TM helix domain-containing protein [Yersinia ruckeri]MCW6540679.1 PepSY domain-containing protein [Yersinia ruckeri]MCW6637022.1 PepSY domain-containing protein [Yersinia ruckeri]UZX64556.1 PepSY domain-containing protein [Yersinia ruckeri]UZX67843.1 PepSY domain-containing protein [Yersinia ruckeri]UZY10790.1 PepSY domain-containing protein [Yersinia ruckeri]
MTAITSSSRAAWLALVTRLHFYIGLFIAPFIFFAALSGTLYVIAPNIEKILYAEQLYPASEGSAKPLMQQIAVAQRAVGKEANIIAVRPAPHSGESTRVMFNATGLNSGESRAIFIDPVTLDVLGDMAVYGSSGSLPLRTWLDKLHSGALLGDVGRNYSELAASWMWVAALGGVMMWAAQRRKKHQARHSKQHNRRRHMLIGLTLLPLLLFISVTGLTWSKWAGDNISLLRDTLAWKTPSLLTALTPEESAPHGEPAPHCHAHSTGMAMPSYRLWRYDAVLEQARLAGIDAARVEIRPGASANHAWTVTEIDRSWPTQVDARAFDITTMQVVDQLNFQQFPLVAKLIRWGIDAHMGILFGVANQLLLVAFGAGLCSTIVIGYSMWWRRRPKHQRFPLQGSLLSSLGRLTLMGKVLCLTPTLLLACCLPLMGVSLAAFLIIDGLCWIKANRLKNLALKMRK